MESSCPAARPEPLSRPPISVKVPATCAGASAGLGAHGALVLVTLFALLGTGRSAGAQSADEGFHGYRWGTRPAAIPVVEEGGQPDREVNGILGHATFLRLLGMPTRAVFYFDGAGEGLVGGKYLSRPGDLSCVAQFRTLRLLVSSDVGDARLELRKGTGADAPTDREGCRRFRRASKPAPWEALYLARHSADTLALVRLFRRGGEPRLMACYRLHADCRWPAEVSVGQAPGLAPARRDTAGSQPE